MHYLSAHLKKKLDSYYIRMLRAVLKSPADNTLQNSSWTDSDHLFWKRSRHAGHWWRSKDELISDILLWTPSHERAKAGRTVRNYIQKLCADIGYSIEDLPGAMDDRDEWRERVREICASSVIWWYAYIYIYCFYWAFNSLLFEWIHIHNGEIYLPTPLLGQDMTQGQFFKRSLTGLNSEFSFS